jgi:hypothetical protein
MLPFVRLRLGYEVAVAFSAQTKEHLMHAVFQPYIDLANANMAAFSRLTDSPELPKMMKIDTETYLQQARGLLAHATQSDAVTEWMQAMTKNYSDFVTNVTQNFFGMVVKGQALLTEQTRALSGSLQHGVDDLVHAGEAMAESANAEATDAAPAGAAKLRKVAA